MLVVIEEVEWRFELVELVVRLPHLGEDESSAQV